MGIRIRWKWEVAEIYSWNWTCLEPLKKRMSDCAILQNAPSTEVHLLIEALCGGNYRHRLIGLSHSRYSLNRTANTHLNDVTYHSQPIERTLEKRKLPLLRHIIFESIGEDCESRCRRIRDEKGVLHPKSDCKRNRIWLCIGEFVSFSFAGRYKFVRYTYCGHVGPACYVYKYGIKSRLNYTTMCLVLCGGTWR